MKTEELLTKMIGMFEMSDSDRVTLEELCAHLESLLKKVHKLDIEDYFKYVADRKLREGFFWATQGIGMKILDGKEDKYDGL